MSVARVQEGLPPARIGQVDPNGLDAERPNPGQRALDVGNEEVEVMRARAAPGTGTPASDFLTQDAGFIPPNPAQAIATTAQQPRAQGQPFGNDHDREPGTVIRAQDGGTAQP